MACYNDPPHPPPQPSGTTGDMFKSYNDLAGTGVRKNWADLANEMLDLAKTHSYARLLSEASTAKRTELAIDIARRHQESTAVSGEIADALAEYKKVTRISEDPPGAGTVDVGPSLPKTGDYLVQKPESLSPYERWVLNRKAAFVYRNRLPHLKEPEDVPGGYGSKAEAVSLWTEAGVKRNQLLLRRNVLCERYNSMAEECLTAVNELMNDNGYVMDQRNKILVDLIKSRQSTSLRRSLTVHMQELHDFINDMQFEIFKLEQLLQEANSIGVAAMHESDLVSKGKRKVLQNIDPKIYRYARSLVAQKTDMYAEYRERIEELGNICEMAAEPILQAWRKVRDVLKASIILTKHAVSKLRPGCPLYPVIKEELKKTNVDYAHDEDSLDALGKDNSILTTIEQMDALFRFLSDVGNYLRTEAQSLTAHMENKEIIRSWRDFCIPRPDDDCT